MVIQVAGTSYTVSKECFSIDQVAATISISASCVKDAIRSGQIRSEKHGDQVMIPAEFVERLIFGDVNSVELPLDSQGIVGGGKCE